LCEEPDGEGDCLLVWESNTEAESAEFRRIHEAIGESKENRHFKVWEYPKMFQWLKRSGAKKVMDFGCGFSPFPQFLCDNGFEVWGVDNDSMGTMGDKNSFITNPLTSSVHYYVGNIHDLDETFDVIFSCSVIEHIPEEDRMPIFKKMRDLSGKMCHIIDFYWPEKRGRDPHRVDIKGIVDTFGISHDPVFCPGAPEFSFGKLRHKENDPHIDFLPHGIKCQESRIMIGDDV
jgi:hypothetical protein